MSETTLVRSLCFGLGIALAEVAEAGCCTSLGVEPLTLASCEGMALVASTELWGETGAYGWDGRWWGADGDGDLGGTASVGIMAGPHPGWPRPRGC